jgi:hypothetical protein
MRQETYTQHVKLTKKLVDIGNWYTMCLDVGNFLHHVSYVYIATPTHLLFKMGKKDSKT